MVWLPCQYLRGVSESISRSGRVEQKVCKVRPERHAVRVAEKGGFERSNYRRIHGHGRRLPREPLLSLHHLVRPAGTCGGQMQPGDPALERAQALVALNRPGDALELAGRALASAPDNPDLHALMSRACLAMKRFKEARTHAQAAIALDPENVSALSCLAAAYAGLRRFKPAKDAVEAALSLAPATPGLFRQEALINIAAGDDEAGLTAALRARALASDDPD